MPKGVGYPESDKEFETEADVRALQRVAEVQKSSDRKRRALNKIKENHQELDTAEQTLSLRSKPNGNSNNRSRKPSGGNPGSHANNGRTY